MGDLEEPDRPPVQRVAAYAVIVRDEQILLTALAPRISPDELWTLPGGGIDHGEHPHDAVVREVHEETGLEVTVGESTRVYSFHRSLTRHDGKQVDAHSLRIVYDGWVPIDSPDPRVVEVDGSTVAAAWIPVAGVLDRSVPVVELVREALRDYRPHPEQRVAAYALVVRDESVLLTRVSPRGFHTGLWTLPGGGVHHGESPGAAVVREVLEECGVACEVGELLVVDDERVRGTAPSGRDEELHTVQIVYAATVAPDAEPQHTELEGTTDAVEWVPLRDLGNETVPVHPLVRTALEASQ